MTYSAYLPQAAVPTSSSPSVRNAIEALRGEQRAAAGRDVKPGHKTRAGRGAARDADGADDQALPEARPRRAA
jgi:hypothetical protein